MRVEKGKLGFYTPTMARNTHYCLFCSRELPKGSVYWRLARKIYGGRTFPVCNQCKTTEVNVW